MDGSDKRRPLLILIYCFFCFSFYTPFKIQANLRIRILLTIIREVSFYRCCLLRDVYIAVRLSRMCNNLVPRMGLLGLYKEIL